MRCDVSQEADIQALVAITRQHYDQVDAFISNAGILGEPNSADESPASGQQRLRSYAHCL